MDEAKKLYVDHLRRTRVVGTTLKVSSDLTSSLSGVTTPLLSLVRTEIGPEPLPVIRDYLMVRVQGGTSRFLLNQTIDMKNGPAGGGAATKIQFLVWDEQHQTADPFPFNPFMSLPGTSIRLYDYLLPAPEAVQSWSVLADGPAHDVLDLAIGQPATWSSPGFQRLRLRLGHDDLRLHSSEALFANGSQHRLEVEAWAPAPYPPGVTASTIREGTQWTRTVISGEVKPHPVDGSYFAKVKLEQWVG